MSRLSDFIKSNKEKIYAEANKNTLKNKDGRAVIAKDDEWREETEWDVMAVPVNLAFVLDPDKAEEFINHTNPEALEYIKESARKFNENQERLCNKNKI